MWIAVSAANGRYSPAAPAPSSRRRLNACPKSIGGHQAPWQVGKSLQASTA